MNSVTMDEREPSNASDTATVKARLGTITRELNEALRALGATPELHRVIREIPDARARLSYVGEMTDKAAHRVLNLVDEAMPQLADYERQLSLFEAQIERELAPPIGAVGAGSAAGLMALWGTFARDSTALVEHQRQILSDIMLTQDFQDLSGQVIKKVIDMITRTESQLAQLLIDEGELDALDQPAETALQGPQTPDSALAQDDVDDLLASMGF